MSTIVTRAGKGSPLTHAEMDANLTNLNTDKVETSGFITDSVTLNVPADYATIAAAFTYLSTKTIAKGATVTIDVADGTYTYTASIYCAHPDGDKIKIIGNTTTPANCTINFSTSDGIYLPQGFQLGEIDGFRFVNTTVKSSATPYLGVLTDGGVFHKVGPKLEVHNFYYGISARNGGYINAGGNSSSYVKVTNAGDVGIWSFIGSYVNCDYAEVSGADDSANGLGGGIVAEFGSTIQANHTYLHNNWLCGVSCISNSAIRAWHVRSEANQHGIIAGSGGIIEVFGNATPGFETIISNNTVYGFYCPDSNGFVYGLSTATMAGNVLGNERTGFTFASDGRLIAASGSITVDANQPGGMTGDSPYLDMDAKVNGFSIIRALEAGIEKARIQYNNTTDSWEIVSGVTVQATIGSSGLVGTSVLTCGNGGVDSYLDMNVQANGFNIIRALEAGVERGRFQYDHTNDRWSLSAGGITSLRHYNTGKIIIGRGNSATGDTTGHLQIPKVAGVPTGVPSDIETGYVPIVFDATNSRIYVYNGSWKMVGVV
jgi:hypothetical protein